MTGHSRIKDEKIDNPANSFEKPSDVIKDSDLSLAEKRNALNTWEQDAHQLITASNEGMPAPDEGASPDDPHHVGQVTRAKEKLGDKPKHKPSQ